jgi:hypothetical protein
VFIQGRNESCLFRGEMNTVLGKKCKNAFSGMKRIMFIQGRNE